MLFVGAIDQAFIYHKPALTSMFDFEPYIEDLESAGAEVVKTTPGDSGPFINVEYHGSFPMLQAELEEDYILLDQFGGPFEDISMVIRPVAGMSFDPEKKGVMGDIGEPPDISGDTEPKSDLETRDET